MKFVKLAGRAGRNGFVGKKALDVEGQTIRGWITARAILLQRLHYDPIQISVNSANQRGRFGMASLRHARQILVGELAQSCGRTNGFLLANHSADFIEPGLQ